MSSKRISEGLGLCTIGLHVRHLRSSTVVNTVSQWSTTVNLSVFGARNGVHQDTSVEPPASPLLKISGARCFAVNIARDISPQRQLRSRVVIITVHRMGGGDHELLDGG
jgi:hypothetical protein